MSYEEVASEKFENFVQFVKSVFHFDEEIPTDVMTREMFFVACANHRKSFEAVQTWDEGVALTSEVLGAYWGPQLCARYQEYKSTFTVEDLDKLKRYAALFASLHSLSFS